MGIGKHHPFIAQLVQVGRRHFRLLGMEALDLPIAHVIGIDQHHVRLWTRGLGGNGHHTGKHS